MQNIIIRFNNLSIRNKLISSFTLLGVAIGLLQAYLFGGREKYLLIPVGILGAISLFFLINNLVFIDFRLLAGILLVLIGIWIIFKKIK